MGRQVPQMRAEQMSEKVNEFLPMTPLWFNILLAAADGPTHGYAMLKEIEARTGGAINPGTGTMYVALQRLSQEGLLEEVEAGSKEFEDRRSRRHYELTAFGREVCAAEARRLASEVEAAVQKKILRDAPGLG